jgi:hypothetical protein
MRSLSELRKIVVRQINLTGWALTDGIHRMRREFKHAIKDKRTTLEETVAPVPAIVLNNMVRLGFDPEIEGDENDTTNPAVSHGQSNRTAQ